MSTPTPSTTDSASHVPAFQAYEERLRDLRMTRAELAAAQRAEKITAILAGCFLIGSLLAVLFWTDIVKCLPFAEFRNGLEQQRADYLDKLRPAPEDYDTWVPDATEPKCDSYPSPSQARFFEATRDYYNPAPNANTTTAHE